MARMRTSLILAATLALVGCTGTVEEPRDGGVRVVAGAWPIEQLLDGLVGDDAQIVPLVPPGVEPHDLELDAADLELVGSADAIVYIGGGFQPALERLVAQSADVPAIDVLDHAGPTLDAEDGHQDPHVWLSPERWSAVAEGVVGALTEAIPGLDATDAAGVVADLRAVADAFEQGLAACARTTLITEHAWATYLAADHGLVPLAVTGVAPEAEVTATRLDELVAQARSSGATAVFTERGGEGRLARTLAEEADLEVVELDPLEYAFEPSETYETRMRANLAALRDGLDCA